MSFSPPSQPVRVCGRVFTPVEVAAIAQWVRDHPHALRSQIARWVCERFGWRTEHGRLKEGSCRTALVRMHRAGWVPLPPPRIRPQNHRPLAVELTSRSDPQPLLRACVQELEPLELVPASRGEPQALWRELISRYHYLGYRRAPGAQMRYLVRSPRGWLAAVGFGPAAWKLGPRDVWIGWDTAQREQNLQYVVGHSRLLILPWVHANGLGSRILSLCTRRLPSDWEERYGRRPLLVETFVEIERFSGTVYRAANWISLGHTQGRGRMDRYKECKEPVKEIFVYPLHRRSRQYLCSPDLPRA